MQHIKNLSCITSRTILSRPDTWKSRFLGYLKVSSRDGIQVDFKLINVDRRVSLCKDLNIVIIENRKIWTSLMSTVAPAPRALIRPGFTFEITLVFRFQGFVDSAHIVINLLTLVDLGIILTISPWPPLEVWPSTSQQRWRLGEIIQSCVAKRSRPEEKTFCLLRKVSPPNHSSIISQKIG